MTAETVQLEVTLLVKADGSDDAWQMQRLCQGLNVKPHGVVKHVIVKTDRENADRLLSWTVDEWNAWAKDQRHGPYAFQVLECSVSERGTNQEPAPVCETCCGSGRVNQTEYLYVDRFTKWERKDPYTINVECPDCNGKVEQ